MIESFNKFLLGLVWALSMVLAAQTLGKHIAQIRQPGLISVKGLAEAEHKATLATWSLEIRAWGADYGQALQAQQRGEEEALQFLLEQGLGGEEWQWNVLSIQPHHEYEFDEQGRERRIQKGYLGQRTLLLRTRKLDVLEQALNAAPQLRLRNQNIEYHPPQYYLEQLENIKRDLIAQATRDAHVRAQEFAQTSGVKVGLLQSAAQGSFDIQSNLPSEQSSDYGGGYDTRSIDKRVRLVVTIQYAIDK